MWHFINGPSKLSYPSILLFSYHSICCSIFSNYCVHMNLSTWFPRSQLKSKNFSFYVSIFHFFKLRNMNFAYLTHLFPMCLFSTYWKHQKIVKVFWFFQGIEKGCIGNKSVNPSFTKYLAEFKISLFFMFDNSLWFLERWGALVIEALASFSTSSWFWFNQCCM